MQPQGEHIGPFVPLLFAQESFNMSSKSILRGSYREHPLDRCRPIAPAPLQTTLTSP